MWAIIIQDTVVDAFRCGLLVMYFLISLCTPWDICVQPDVPYRPGLDDAAIFGRGGAAFAFCFVIFSIRAVPHLASNVAFGSEIISIRNHRKPSGTDRSGISINADVIMSCFGMTAFSVEVNQGTYIAVLEELVSGKIVHSGTKALILYREAGHIFFQLMERDEEGNRIMAFRAGEAEEQGDIRMQYRVVTGKLE